MQLAHATGASGRPSTFYALAQRVGSIVVCVIGTAEAGKSKDRMMMQGDAEMQGKTSANADGGVLNIALCGLGRAARGLMTRELAALPQVKIVGAFDVIGERARELAGQVGGRAYGSFEELLRDPAVELVVVATRSVDHVPMAKQALAAGKHVLLEKPMAMDLRGADELLEAAKGAAAASGARLFIRHNRRFEPALLQTREIIASGKLGTVFQINLRVHKFQMRNDWQTLKEYGGGQLLNWGPHVIDWGLQLLESPLRDFWSDLKRVVTAGDAEDTVKLLLRGTNGRVVDIEISDAVAIAQPGWMIYGSRGALVIEDTTCRMKYLDASVKGEVEADLSTPSASGGYAGPAKLVWVEETFELGPKVKTKLFETVYAAIKKGGEVAVTLEEARENMRVIEGARQGASGGGTGF